MANPNLVPAIGRSIETQEAYAKFMAEYMGKCALCDSVELQQKTDLRPHIGARALRLSNPDFTVIENDFPYEIYDGQQILAHHMIVPVAHYTYTEINEVAKLRHGLSDAEAELQELTDNAYGTIMGRSSNSIASSQSHAHRHLFITGTPAIEQHFSIAEGSNDFRFSGQE